VDPQEQVFSVPFRFPVYFTRDVWEPANTAVRDAVSRLEPSRRHRVLVVIDENLLRAQPTLLSQIFGYFAANNDTLDLIGQPVIVPGGEPVKNDITHVFGLLQRVNDAAIDRQSTIAVMGGGAVLDMVSFAAAIAHRGIRVVRLPTTVLAQGDSGIAVKTSVNLFGKKNFIGTFTPPFAVINDRAMLESLSWRDKIAGVSEAIKVALLKDPAFYRWIESQAGRIAAGEVDVLAPLVQRSAELHLQHICGQGDPFELGSARPLDFGHWAAHKLESMTNHLIRHGEAVAIGMALDLAYSEAKGHLDRATMERILRLLEGVGFQLWNDALEQRGPDGAYTLLRGLSEFREHLGGELHITLLRAVGEGFEVTAMDDQEVAAAIEVLRFRQSRRPLVKASTRR
jgi:3-dehydroquinate synthase